MAIERVKEFFSQYEMQAKIREFDVQSATVDQAALALNCEPERIAKTLSFKTKDEVVLVVAAGDTKIDNSKFKSEFKTKAKMLTPDQVVEFVGHEVGGVCPFGIKEDVVVFLDISLKRFETVYPACGSSNSAIELTISELEEYSKYSSWIDVCKAWE